VTLQAFILRYHADLSFEVLKTDSLLTSMKQSVLGRHRSPYLASSKPPRSTLEGMVISGQQASLRKGEQINLS
jgi:hypothetical protein